jgi:ribonuclease HI
MAEARGDLEQGTWTLYCDGASRGNPGPAGAGAVLADPRGEIRVRASQYLGVATNNVAEYRALLLGLQEARKLGVRKIRVFADSELLVRQLHGSYRVKAPHLLPLWQEASRELQKFEAHAVSHVPRQENSQADGLANLAIDRKPPTE